jgi:hypothetical protein
MIHFWRPSDYRWPTFGDLLATDDQRFETFWLEMTHFWRPSVSTTSTVWSLRYNLLLTPYINKIHNTPGTCSNAYLLLVFIHIFICSTLINQDHMNLCQNLSNFHLDMCKLPTTLQHCHSRSELHINRPILLTRGYEWERSCHNATKRKHWNTGCYTYDSSIMLHVLQMHRGKMRRWGGGWGNLSTVWNTSQKKMLFKFPSFLHISLLYCKNHCNQCPREYHVKCGRHTYLKLWCLN